ncbi:MAG: hypothetical protein A3E85_03410 [Gammaproteobacteria bacterium RIFCSPHIGHO2_12_FULL_45_12]|nr:MAG: hypothetical protein A3E85_03410 [Gammaproteobacteria bacterium RIFCSPHIGHO2_12_FULL_45_12]
MSWRNALQLSLAFFCFMYACHPFAGTPLPRLASSEHLAAGDAVHLSFFGEPSSDPLPHLSLPNGLSLSYGEILLLGDFYEVVGESLAQAKSDAVRRERFIKAFYSLAQAPQSVSEAKAILAVAHAEYEAVEAGMEQGEKPEDVYRRIGAEDNRQWNCLTGGGCSRFWYLHPGRYLQLSKEDFDHFGQHALLAYQTGHAAALETATLAAKTKDNVTLSLAYAMNAFASHFLTDQFSSGHLRVPRQALFEQVSPSVIGSILVNYMHNEEDEFGLQVHNARGDHWKVYGDRYYFDASNRQTRVILNEALQASVDEVSAAAMHPLLAQSAGVTDLLPEADSLEDRQGEDIAPLFYWDAAQGKVLRRVDMSNEFDYHWTSEWWGWSTLLKLAEQRGLPEDAQGALALSSSGQKAVNNGLIRNQSIVHFVDGGIKHS